MKTTTKNFFSKVQGALRKVTAATLCMSLLLGAIGFITVGCEKEKATNNLQYVKTELGGCNLSYDLRKSYSEIEMENDTVIVTISENSANVFVGINFTCKVNPFETQIETIDDVTYIHIIGQVL